MLQQIQSNAVFFLEKFDPLLSPSIFFRCPKCIADFSNLQKRNLWRFSSLLSIQQKEIWKIFEAYLDNAKLPDGVEELPAILEPFKEVNDREYLCQSFQYVFLCFDALHCVSGITRTIVKHEMEQTTFFSVKECYLIFNTQPVILILQMFFFFLVLFSLIII